MEANICGIAAGIIIGLLAAFCGGELFSRKFFLYYVSGMGVFLLGIAAQAMRQ